MPINLGYFDESQSQKFPLTQILMQRTSNILGRLYNLAVTGQKFIRVWRMSREVLYIASEDFHKVEFFEESL